MAAHTGIHNFKGGFTYIEQEKPYKCEGMKFEVGDKVCVNKKFKNEFMVNNGKVHRIAVAKGQIAFLVSYPWYGIARIQVPEVHSKESAVIDVPSYLIADKKTKEGRKKSREQ